MALVAFIIQIISGIFLVMYYQPNIHTAFDSVNYTIMKEIPFMWLIRHIHAAGANFFLAVVYLHIFTGIYYNAYKNLGTNLDCGLFHILCPSYDRPIRLSSTLGTALLLGNGGYH